MATSWLSGVSLSARMNSRIISTKTDSRRGEQCAVMKMFCMFCRFCLMFWQSSLFTFTEKVLPWSNSTSETWKMPSSRSSIFSSLQTAIECKVRMKPHSSAVRSTKLRKPRSQISQISDSFSRMQQPCLARFECWKNRLRAEVKTSWMKRQSETTSSFSFSQMLRESKYSRAHCTLIVQQGSVWQSSCDWRQYAITLFSIDLSVISSACDYRLRYIQWRNRYRSSRLSPRTTSTGASPSSTPSSPRATGTSKTAACSSSTTTVSSTTRSPANQNKDRKEVSKKIPFDFDLKFELIREQDKEGSPRSKSPSGDKGKTKKKPSKPFGISFQKEQTTFSVYTDDEALLVHWKAELGKRLVQRGFHSLFRPIKKIGKGNFASVYLAERLQDETKFAVKAFSKEAVFQEDKGKESLINQIAIMRKLNHPSLMSLSEVYQSDNSIYLCVELLEGGQLYDPIKEKHKFTDPQVKKIMVGILRGLEHMASKRIMHRDIKPENIIIRTEGSWDAVIADFGLATECDIPEYLYVRCGTPGYVAPEIVNLKDLKAKGDPICDVFSAGLIFHLLVSGKSAFPGKTYNEVLAQNRACTINFDSPEMKKVPEPVVALLKKMLEKDPKHRISASDALKHPFFDDVQHDYKHPEGHTSEKLPYSPALPKAGAVREEALKDDSCIKFHMKESVMTGKTNAADCSPDVKDSPNLRKIMPMSKFVGTGGDKKAELSKFGIGKKTEEGRGVEQNEKVKALKEELKKLNV